MAALAHQGEPRGDSQPGQDLNGLEQREREDADDHEDPDAEQPLEGSRDATRRLGRVRRLLLVAVLVFMIPACLPAQLEQGPGILGSYVVNGVDPNGTEYTGRVSITEGSGPGEVEIEWVVTGAIIHGTGRLSGDTLSVDWETVSGPRGVSSGTAEYTVTDAGHLVGTRLVDGIDTPGTEEIFPEP